MLFRDTNPCRQKRKLGKVGRKLALERLEFRQLLVGFAGTGINGDTSVGFEFFVGSGGGEGGGGNAETNLARFFGYGGGNGGVAGGAGFQASNESAGGGGGGVSAGGGVIQQQATQEIIALTSSQIIADGAGFANLQGGFGAGGGVGLFAPSITVEQHATIRTLGGFDDGIGSTINGGTIKILYFDQFAGTLPQGNSGRSHVSAGMQVPVIDAQRTVSGDLRVTWTVGTAATEVMVFTKATGWDSFVTKQTAWGNSKELTFYGLRDATYHVAARSWSRLADDSWKPSGLSGRVPYLVACSSNSLCWGGGNDYHENGNNYPKIYAPPIYEPGSSSHTLIRKCSQAEFHWKSPRAEKSAVVTANSACRRGFNCADNFSLNL